MQNSFRQYRAIVLVAVLALFGEAAAQDYYEVTYRPRNVHYDLLQTEHFDLIFQTGAQQLAREAGSILENEFDDVSTLVGLKRSFRMPVVLNTFNDVGNGKVTPLMFRQEIEAAALKGKFLDPGFPSWMHSVLPHELVHAAHAEIRPRFGVGGLLALFSRDLSRMLNFSIPPGMTEGVAVYHESRMYEDAGRLNFSFFNMQYRAAMNSRRPWTLAQMLEASAYSLPYNRHYIGGSFAFKHLASARGEEFFAKSVARYNRWPFFGYGFSLWTSVRQPPWKIGRGLRTEARLIPPGAGYGNQGALVAGRRGLNHYRPQWLSPSEVIAYADGYDIRRGFYVYDIKSGARRTVAHHSITEDRGFSLTADRRQLLYSRYVPHITSPVQAIADLFRLDLDSGRSLRISRGARLFSPIEVDDSTTWAAQNRGQFASWIALSSDGNVTRKDVSPRAVHKEFALCRRRNLAAALVGLDGSSLVLVGSADSATPESLEPILKRDSGSIFDISWSPECRYVLFTSDPHGKPDIFAHEIESGRTVRLTDARFGAFEGAVSADGKTLAFIDYLHERRDLRTIAFLPEQAALEEEDTFDTSPQDYRTGQTKRHPVELADGKITDYRPGLQAVRPRLIFPTLSREEVVTDDKDVDLGWAFGMQLGGNDPLESWAYGAHLYHQAKRMWGEFSVQSASQSWLPSLRAYVTPSSQLVRLGDPEASRSDTVRLGRYERGLEIKSRLPLTISSDVYFTGATARFGAKIRQTRFMDFGNGVLDPYPSAKDLTTRLTLSPAYTIAYRIQSNPRDLTPNTGVVFRSNAELDVWTYKSGAETAPSPSRAWLNTVSLYLPLSVRWHQSLRIDAGFITQNAGSIYDLDTWVPRGYEDDLRLGGGTFLKGGLQYTTPLWFIDNGFVVVPAYFKVLMAYVFAETVADTQFKNHWSSVGAGLGLDMRVAHTLSLTIRVAAAWQVENRKLVAVFR